MVAAIRSSRFDAIARTLAAAFEAAKEHCKTSPLEYELLMEAAAAHVRAAAPMSMLANAPAPLSSIRTPIGAGFYALTLVGPTMALVVSEPSGRDAALTLTDPQAEGLIRDVAAVRACAALEAKNRG